MKTEFVVKLIDAAELLRDVCENTISLLEQAECELELALDILEDVDSDKARRFVARHSTPARARRADESAVFDAPKAFYITGETVTRKND